MVESKKKTNKQTNRNNTKLLPENLQVLVEKDISLKKTSLTFRVILFGAAFIIIIALLSAFLIYQSDQIAILTKSIEFLKNHLDFVSVQFMDEVSAKDDEIQRLNKIVSDLKINKDSEIQMLNESISNLTPTVVKEVKVQK